MGSSIANAASASEFFPNRSWWPIMLVLTGLDLMLGGGKITRRRG
jgi:hypothetical protein